MTNLVQVATENFKGVEINFYQQGENIGITREQVGQALGYKDPRVAIAKIHDRHADRFEGKCYVTKSVTQLKDRWGGEYERVQEVILYNSRGLMEICRWSSKPKANDFMDWVFDKIDTLATNAKVAICSY